MIVYLDKIKKRRVFAYIMGLYKKICHILLRLKYSFQIHKHMEQINVLYQGQSKHHRSQNVHTYVSVLVKRVVFFLAIFDCLVLNNSCLVSIRTNHKNTEQPFFSTLISSFDQTANSVRIRVSHSDA